MKKICLFLLAILLFSINLKAQDSRIKVAVLDPTTSGISMDEGTKLAVQELISSTIVNTGKFTIVERSMIDKIVKEQSFQNSDIADNTQATAIGKLAGANKVVLSVVSLVGGRNMLSIKIIDVETATIDQQKTKIVDSNDLLDVVEPLTTELLGGQGNYVKQNTVFVNNVTPQNNHQTNENINNKDENVSQSLRFNYDGRRSELTEQISKEIRVLYLTPNNDILSLKKSGKVPMSTNLSSGLLLELDDSGVLKISGDGAMTPMDIDILKKYKSYAVALIVEEGVTNITPFENFSKLKDVMLPTTINSLPSKAFKACSKLQYIIIPSTVITIGAEAFKGCTELLTAFLPNGLSYISESLFEGCKALTETIIPESVIRIDKYAFEGCAQIKSLVIPNSVMSIGEGSFKNMKSLFDLSISDNINVIPSNAFNGCESLFCLTFSKNVHTIGDNAFDNCSNLSLVTFLCENMLKFGESCFEDCDNLGNIVLNSIRPPSADDLFDDDDIYKSCILTVPQSTMGLYQKSHVWRDFETIIPMK